MIGYQFLIRANAVKTATRAEEVLQFSCGPAFTGGGGTWHPCIIDPGLFQVTLFSGSKTYGASSYGYGEAVLANKLDLATGIGPLDGLNLGDYEFNGRGITMWVGPANATFPDGFTVAYTAVIENATINWDTVTFAIKGKQRELDIPFRYPQDPVPVNPNQREKFAGSNVLPEGVEGVESDLKDKMKPILIGRAYNFEPSLCNTSKLVYAVTPLTGLYPEEFKGEFRVYDNGVRLTYGGTVADSAALLAVANITSGQYLVSRDGYFRLGSKPSGQITCSGVMDGYGLHSCPSDLITSVLTTAGFASMVDAVNTYAFKNLDNRERGLYLKSPKNISAILDELLAPIGYWYTDRNAKIQLGQMIAPEDPLAPAPVFALDSATNISSFARRKSTNTVGGIPPNKVTLQYAKNNTVQANPAGSVSPTRKAWLAEQWRSESVLSDIQSDPAAVELIIESALSGVDAGLMATLKNLFCARRELVDVDIIRGAFLDTIEIAPGQFVTLDLHGRFGYNEKKMLVVGVLTNYVEEKVKLTLWG